MGSPIDQKVDIICHMTGLPTLYSHNNAVKPEASIERCCACTKCACVFMSGTCVQLFSEARRELWRAGDTANCQLPNMDAGSGVQYPGRPASALT